jgi:hypothetical protein
MREGGMSSSKKICRTGPITAGSRSQGRGPRLPHYGAPSDDVVAGMKFPKVGHSIHWSLVCGMEWIDLFNNAELRALLDWKRAFEEFEA